MADTIDSISIELTANTQSAENSIQRVIDALRMLQSAAIDASAESRIGKSIRSIAKAAKEVDTDAGQRLARLAGGLKALSKVGDLSNLADAGKNLSGVVRAVNSIGQAGGKGLSNLADGIKQTNDALGSIKDADVSKLNAVRDALSGEMSGSLHTSTRASESAALGGIGTPEPSFGNMAAYGAMTVFKYTADSIRDATAAYREFVGALAQGGTSVETQFSDSAMTVFRYTADSIRDATAAYREFQAALGSGVPPIFTDFADSAAQAGESVRMLTGSVGGNNEGPWMADEIRDSATAFDDVGNSASSAADIIETEFVNNSETMFSRFNNALWNVGNTAIQTGKYLGNSIGTALLNVGKGIIGLGHQIARIAKYRLIRALLKDITQSYKDLYGWSKLSGTDFANSMDKINTAFLYLRNSIVSMVAPLVNALAPALDFIIDKVVEVLNWFNQFFAAISGAETYTVAKKYKQTWGDTFKDTSKEAQEATDEIKRTIMGFDEINKLQKKTIAGHDASGSSPYSSGYEYMFEERPLSGGFQGFGNAIETALQDTLSRITLIIGGAELAVGALLAFSGANIPLGIALMATGAVTMGSAILANWEGIPDQIKLVIGWVEAALGAGLAIGAIIAFSGGNIGLGIGMMIAALSLEWSAVNITWTTLKDKVGGQIQAIVELISGVTFTIGALLAFAGHPGIGIAMMIASASVAAVSINWNYLKAKLEGPIGAVTALISGASLVLGVLMLLAGNVPLGLGLVAAGAGGLVTTVAANWDNIVNLGSTIIEKVKEGMTKTIKNIGDFIKNYIINPIVKAWNWLLGIFGGGDDEGVTANASVNFVSNASGVADEIADEVGDKETIRKLKDIGGTMGDAIKTGMMDKLKNVSDAIWDTIVEGWTTQTRELPIGITFGTNDNVNVPQDVDITVGLVKNWTGTALAALGLNNLSTNVTVGLVRDSSWANSTALAYLNIANLSTKITVDLVRAEAWKNTTVLAYLNVANLATKIVVSLVKESAWAASTALAILNVANLSTSITVKLVKESTWAASTALAILNVANLSTSITVKLVKESTWAGSTALAVLNVANLATKITVSLVKDSKWAATTALAYLNVDSLATRILVDLVRMSSWKNTTALAYLNVDNLSTSIVADLVKADAWKNTSALAYLNVAALSTKITVDLVRADAWKNTTALAYLNIASLSANVSVYLKKEWTVTPQALLGLTDLTANVTMYLAKGWTGTVQSVLGLDNLTATVTVTPKYSDPGDGSFGGAVGGGGSTTGGGAGRYTTYDVKPNLIEPTQQEAKSFWERVKEALSAAGNAVDKGLDVVVRPALNAAGDRITSIWQWISGSNTATPTVDVSVGATKNFKNGTTSYNNIGYWAESFGAAATVAVGLEKNFKNGTSSFSSPSYWAESYGAVVKLAVSLEKNFKKGTTTYSSPAYWASSYGSDIDVTVSLKKDFKHGETDYSSPAYWAKSYGSATTVSVGLTRDFKHGSTTYSSPALWAKSYGYKATVTVNLTRDFKNGSSTYSSPGYWAKSYGSTTTVSVGLTRDFRNGNSVYSSPAYWAKSYGSTLEITVGLKKNWSGSVSDWADKQTAEGGVFSNRVWHDLPQYAGGTVNAHGSLFLAGEAGPEIVGHVGGRTEVLNRSQLAATMFAAVRAAMQGVKIAATFYNGGASGEGESDYDAMYRAMYDAFTDAMAGSDARDQEKIQLMRRIAEKELVAEVTAVSMNRAQTRMNRRAGMTIVPVGT